MKMYCTKCLPEKVEVQLISEPTPERSLWQFRCPNGRNPNNPHLDLFGWEGVTVEHEEKITQSKEDIFKGQKEAKEGLAKGQSDIRWGFPESGGEWEESEATKKVREQVELEKDQRKKILGGE